MQPAADVLLDEGEPADDGTGNRRPVGRDGPVRADSRRAQGREEVPAARRAAVRQRRDPHRPRAQQDAQGPGGEVPQHAGLRRAVHPGMGLPRPADRAEGRPRARPEEAADDHGRVPPRVPRLRAEVRRHPAARVQAARHPRLVGRPLPDHELRLPGAHRPRARQVRRERHGLQGQEAGALVHALPHRAGRSRGRIRAAHLAVDLRRVPAERREPAGAGEARSGTLAWRQTFRFVGLCPDLDDDAVDHPVEPGDRIPSGLSVRRLRRRRPGR